jgi:signal transduction histidine kinase/CheY-like chemotaxis protein
MTTREPAARPPSLGVLRRLETHVALAVTLVVALALAAALFIATRVVTAGSLERTSSQLAAARSAFYQLQDDRAEFAAAQATLVTSLPVFRAHMTDSRLAGDLATMQVLADEYRQQLKAAFCIVTGRDGTWTGRSGWSRSTEPPASISRMVSSSAAGQARRDIAAIGDRLFLVVSEPARFADETLGTLTIGYALDDAVARQLAQVTHCDVNIVIGRHLAASSLTDNARATLAAVIAADPSLSADREPRMERLSGGEFIAGAFPLSPDGDPHAIGRLILLQDWAPTKRYLTELRRQLFVAGLAIFALALAGGLILARRVSRPLKDMASAARDIASGNWTRQVPVHGSAEATVLALAFNEMTISLRHWYEEAKRRDEELLRAQKMEAIGRLAGGIAHDFNNLLTTMKGYAELAMLRLEGPGPAMDELAEIVGAVNRASDLTKQLLAFSRRQAVTPEPLALDQLVANTEHMLRRVIGEDIELVMSIEPDLGQVLADRSQMEQVLLNLVINARDAMPAGGALRIELSAPAVGGAAHDGRDVTPPGRYVCLTVSDSGSGMDQKTASRIFEPFFTTKGVGRGTGLGLAIVYGIVQQAGGTIEVDTEIGHGTTFYVYLPQTAEGAKPKPAAPGPERAPAASRGGSETVLLAEDDLQLRTLISTTLRAAGYTVFEASSGEEALEIARRVPIDLVLTDVVMRGMDGRVLSGHVTSIRPGTRVLFMSGYADDTVLRHGIQTTSAQFIRKPFSTDALIAKVRDLL